MLSDSTCLRSLEQADSERQKVEGGWVPGTMGRAVVSSRV